MFEQFTKEEVRILKKICENPIFKESQPLHVKKISSMKKLKFLVCEKYGIEIKNLEGINKSAEYVKARKEYISIAYKVLGKSVYQIADSINKTHANVLHHLGKVTPETNETINKMINKND
jgi:chromosomal replication initiation ATPase DnaA|tara:strand:+ start:144 stop:503 length:360 start_codon:yes stop_codon:yes gene_type:complete